MIRKKKQVTFTSPGKAYCPRQKKLFRKLIDPAQFPAS
jgi:hypothetical protein